MPTRTYLDSTVVPLLHEAMKKLVFERYEDLKLIIYLQKDLLIQPNLLHIIFYKIIHIQKKKNEELNEILYE